MGDLPPRWIPPAGSEDDAQQIIAELREMNAALAHENDRLDRVLQAYREAERQNLQWRDDSPGTS